MPHNTPHNPNQNPEYDFQKHLLIYNIKHMKFFLIGQLVYTILISLYIAFYKKAKASMRVKLIGFVIGTYILFLLKVTDIYSIELTIKNILIINIAILFISEVFLRLSRFKIELKQRKEERRNQLQEIHDKQKAQEQETLQSEKQ